MKSERKVLLGLAAADEVTCDKCGATFARVDDKYKLVKVFDKTSVFWQNYKEHSLTTEKWKGIADGLPLHYDPKVGTYIPYVPDQYSNFKPSYGPPLPANGLVLTHTPFIEENSPTVDSINTAKVVPEESDELRSEITETSGSIELETKESPHESHPLGYRLTEAGEYLLSMTFNDFLETYHLLKCVEEERELDPEQLKSLLEAGLIRRKRKRV